MASTKDRQRALERARYERVQGKIAQKRREAARKRRIAVVSTVAAVVVAAGVTLAFTLPGSSPKTPTAAGSSSPSAVASATASATSTADSNPMKYEAEGTSSKPGIGVPTFNAADAAKPYTVTIQTNRGNIVFTALTTKAPYTTYSFAYLAQKGFYDNTPCPRISDQGLYMLQCGDPTGTGTGGPGYTIPDENLNAFGTGQVVNYPAGTVAMANTGAPHSGGSQFFLVFQDSQLPPSYTPFGTITQGLDILKQIAAKGNDGSSQAGGGKPNESVQIEKVTIKQG